MAKKDLEIIKRKLINENKLEELLESIGCHSYKTEQRGFLVTCGLPDSENKRSVQVKMNDFLNCKIRSRPDFDGKDIYHLVSYIHFNIRGIDELNSHIPKAKEYICRLFGWEQFVSSSATQQVIVKDYTACLKEILGYEEKSREIKPNPVLSESILDEYIPYPYQGWIEEGISYETQKMYSIGFDLDSKRITIPMRNKNGELVGVKGRIMKDEDDDRKYLYLYRYNNSQELFNYHYAKVYAQMEKRIFMLEAEKSPMQLFSNGVYNAVGIGASDITEAQVDLIREMGEDIEVVLCYDKGISISQIKKQAKKFRGMKVSGMLDTDDLLEDKMSPTDKGIDTWNILVDRHIYPINE